MSTVRVRGRLVCATPQEAEIVRSHLPAHVELTRAEPGCLRFVVAQTDDTLVWWVEELFADDDAFDRHQRRVSQSLWGRVTAGIERQYSITKDV
ncbi:MULTISPECIES: putative quinol monooxygenase [Microbacterium]|jgi:quinol monooxygenase YgiN|uniref:Antibiotic biosynthesis monooxygenase n=1 Tax=Microbacterium mcarthurae TaxID=3035918 RepID=A0ABW9GBI9_9MICO|nr:antibiotic biosynthesis monooxygenase [Microbacterium sp. ACRRU]MCG7417232.1 antibiotic biosynthesis monooxygenase [Microbacterium sp. ACRRU]